MIALLKLFQQDFNESAPLFINTILNYSLILFLIDGYTKEFSSKFILSKNLNFYISAFKNNYSL